MVENIQITAGFLFAVVFSLSFVKFKKPKQ